MLTKDKLVNIICFMERATATGKEALAWAQTYESVLAEIGQLDAAEKQRVFDRDHPAA